MRIRVNHQPSGGKEWVAKITGKHPQYKFEREFLTADDREWSSTGKTGWTYYEIEDGEIYEVNEPWHGRRFITVENGEEKEITKEEVLKAIEKMEEAKKIEKSKKEEFMEEVEKNEEDGHKKVKMQGTKKEEMKIRVNHQPSGGKEWVAKIIGKDPQYKFAREFQSIEEKEWSNTGKTGWSYFEVEEGQIYEVNEPWHGRYFIKIENGEMKEIHTEEVLKAIEKMEEAKK